MPVQEAMRVLARPQAWSLALFKYLGWGPLHHLKLQNSIVMTDGRLAAIDLEFLEHATFLDFSDLPWFLRVPPSWRERMAEYVDNSKFGPHGDTATGASDERFNAWSGRFKNWYADSDQCMFVNKLAEILNLEGYFPTKDRVKEIAQECGAD